MNFDERNANGHPTGNCPIIDYCGSVFGEFMAVADDNTAQSGITSFLCMDDHIIVS